jgi:hypothetical protein
MSKFTRHFSPTVPPFPARGLHVVVDVGAPGGTSGNFQNWARTISLHGCSTYGGTIEEGEDDEEDDKEEEEEEGGGGGG